MPYSVEEVKFMIEALRLTLVEPVSLGASRSGLEGSTGVEGSSGVRSNTRRGRGRRIVGSSDMLGGMLVPEIQGRV